MIITETLGYPRIGLNREMKKALESFWIGKITAEELSGAGRAVRRGNWEIQKKADIDRIPSNDFSYYDHMLDHAVLFGACPPRFENIEFKDKFQKYFAMARGYSDRSGKSIPPLEMTKWFNTNYHYLVPEIYPDTAFRLNSEKIIGEFQEAKEQGIETKPVIIGPVTFLMLSKSPIKGFSPLSRLDDILEIYKGLFSDLRTMGVQWIQLDEPWLILNLDDETRSAYEIFFEFARNLKDKPKILLAAYFGDISINRDLLEDFPFEGLHVDLTGTNGQPEWMEILPREIHLSLGIIDGRNIWRSDLFQKTGFLGKIIEENHFGNLSISPSCSLLHVPQDVELEKELDKKVESWLAFGKQKLAELSAIKQYLNNPSESPQLFIDNREAINTRNKILKSDGKNKDQNRTEGDSVLYDRQSEYKVRRKLQEKALKLPILPTTTIGSFPQTKEIRLLRSKYRKGELSREEYKDSIKKEITRTIRFQEEIGLDVLVHGEFERNDMVQYFAERMDGFAFTKNGWVQSYGSRYVRPSIIYGNIGRPDAITVEWAAFAQSKSEKPVKGMLTGPVTILQWSFVRDDQPREETCRQIAFALREEVADLEKAGISIIQIDEPAFREGLPLQAEDRQEYLDWAVECFRIASSVAADSTQIHTHMCYSEFNQIMDSIARLDADVISIEASRSKMDLLGAFSVFQYPNEIGPGVYDIHSPSTPTTLEIIELINKALKVIHAERLWINPDCGLKTRKWEEIEPALRNMVAATKSVRKALE